MWSDKLCGYSQISQVWPYLNLSIIIKLPFSEQEHVQIFPFPSPSKTCASLPFCARERPEKYLLLSEWCKRIIQTRSSIFCYLIDMNIYTQNLPVCNSGQHTYVTGLFNFFLCSSRFDLQNRFLFPESNFLEELASYWLLILYVTSFFQCK